MIYFKKLLAINILFVLAISVSNSAWSFDEVSVKKLIALNKCERCDLSGDDLREADLNGSNLSGAMWKGVKLDGAILCKTRMPSGIDNSDCK